MHEYSSVFLQESPCLNLHFFTVLKKVSLFRKTNRVVLFTYSETKWNIKPSRNNFFQSYQDPLMHELYWSDSMLKECHEETFLGFGIDYMLTHVCIHACVCDISTFPNNLAFFLLYVKS